MIKAIAIAVVVLIGTVLIYAATKPDVLHVQRSTSIKAPPEKVFALINDFRGWSAWSPYEKKDPAMKRTFSGPPQGEGAVYEWAGNKDVGKGRMEIAEASAPSRIAIRLHFIAPIEGHSVAEFTLNPKDDATRVTWAMHGPNRYIGKLMQVFFDVDQMIGQDFEAGLANLKALAEKQT